MYYKFLSTNIDQCILITEKEKAILFLNDKTIGFLSNSTDNFFKPSDTNTLDITQNDLIYENSIKGLKYTKSDTPYDNIELIRSGDTDTENSNSYNITLKEKSLIFKLKEIDIVYSKIDLYGKYYKIRVPRFTDQSDTVYKAWSDENYTEGENSEMQLIDDLEYREIQSCFCAGDVGSCKILLLLQIE
jgi:hypothetical protein